MKELIKYMIYTILIIIPPGLINTALEVWKYEH